MKCSRPTAIALLLAATWLGRGADPKIDHIETYVLGGVLLHIYTEVNRTYQLQYNTTPCGRTNAACSTNWVTLLTLPALPFDDHYVFWDQGSKTNKQRFYRLAVTP